MSVVADRYISQGGRLPSYGRSEYVDDLQCLAWAEKNGDYYAGYSAKEAFQAMARLLDVDVVGLRRAVMA